jgi:pimeloyl-ACP methyl ester carboxylesterase
LRLKNVILAGSSMGAVSSLYAAILAEAFGVNVRGLVLALPPTYGVYRQAQAKKYIGYAGLLRQMGLPALVSRWSSDKPTPFLEREFPQARDIFLNQLLQADPLSVAAILEGAAHSDYPSGQALQALKMPTLLLSRSDDPAHPMEAADYIAQHLPQSQRIHATNGTELRKWPAQIEQFLKLTSKGFMFT